jgi:hypothetical protein
MSHICICSLLEFSINQIQKIKFAESKYGKVVETANVIRCLAPAAIIQQFKQYCVENDEVPLGKWCISLTSLVLLQQVPTLSRLDILQSTYLSK